jgi:hypothetical protein
VAKAENNLNCSEVETQTRNNTDFLEDYRTLNRLGLEANRFVSFSGTPNQDNIVTDQNQLYNLWKHLESEGHLNQLYNEDWYTKSEKLYGIDVEFIQQMRAIPSTDFEVEDLVLLYQALKTNLQDQDQFIEMIEKLHHWSARVWGLEFFDSCSVINMMYRSTAKLEFTNNVKFTETYFDDLKRLIADSSEYNRSGYLERRADENLGLTSVAGWESFVGWVDHLGYKHPAVLSQFRQIGEHDNDTVHSLKHDLFFRSIALEMLVDRALEIKTANENLDLLGLHQISKEIEFRLWQERKLLNKMAVNQIAAISNPDSASAGTAQYIKNDQADYVALRIQAGLPPIQCLDGPVQYREEAGAPAYIS